MKKSLLLMFLVLLFLICLVSCPNPSEKVQINFMAYDQNNGGSYRLYKSESVAKGSSFNENSAPTIGPVVLPDDETTVYKYKYWTNSRPEDLNSPCTDSLGRFYEGTQIDNNINLYVVYKEEAASKYSITYKVWKDNSYDKLITMQNVVEGTLLKNISHPTDAVVDVEIGGTKYTFAKNRWAKPQESPDEIINSSDGNYQTTDEITDNDVLTEDLTLYAVYGELKTVDFRTWKKETNYSVELPGYKIDVLKGEKIDLDGDYKNIAKESVNDEDSIIYHFAYWKKIEPGDDLPESLLKNKNDDGYVSGGWYDLENVSMGENNIILCAVYGEQNHINYKKLTYDDTLGLVSNDLSISGFNGWIDNGTKFNDIPADNKPSSSTDHLNLTVGNDTYYFTGKYSTQKPSTVTDFIKLNVFNEDAPIKEDLVLYPIYTKNTVKVTYYTYNQETHGYTKAHEYTGAKDQIIPSDNRYPSVSSPINSPIIINPDGSQNKYEFKGWLKSTSGTEPESIVTGKTPFEFDETPISQDTVFVAIYKKLNSHKLSFYSWDGNAGETGDYKEIEGSQKMVFDGELFKDNKPDSDPADVSIDSVNYHFAYWTIEKTRGNLGLIVTTEAGDFAPFNDDGEQTRVLDENDSLDLKFYAVYKQQQ